MGAVQKKDGGKNFGALMKGVIYLAGDWKNPPTRMAELLESLGYRVQPKWWIPDERVTRSGNLSLLIEEVTAADVFVFDMRSDRYGEHYMAGCHIAVGLAAGSGKPIYVVPGDDASRLKVHSPTGTYTSLLARHTVTEKELLGALDKT